MNAEVVWHGALWREAEPPVVKTLPDRVHAKGDIREQILAALANGGELSISGLQERLHRGYHDTRDTVRALVAEGQLERVCIGTAIRYRVVR